MKAIIGLITGIAGIIGIIGSVIAMRYWLLTVVIMTILKLTGVVLMPWFTGPLTVGAISTGLFMLLGGLVMMAISFAITAIAATLIETQN